MKMSLPKLRKVIRKVLQESFYGGPVTPDQDASEELAFEIASKLMYTDYRKETQVADEMSGGRYSADPSFKQLVDDMFEMLEREALGPEDR